MGGNESKLPYKGGELPESTMDLKINGTSYTVNLATLAPDTTLNTFIREHAQLTATKFMCLEGGCGACVVSIRGKNHATGEIKIWSAHSCLVLLNTCGSWEITTCEGIGNQRDNYHPIQKRMAQLNATQCGYCTTGFVMNMYSLLESKRGQVSMAEVENAFSGNICRCTGYRPILDAMKSFASDNFVMLPPKECQDIEDLIEKKCPKSDSGALCSGQCHKPLKVFQYGDNILWFWPQNLKELLHILTQIPGNEEYMLVGGNTAHGVYRRSENIKHFIDTHAVAELREFNLAKDKLTLGANLTLSEAMDIFNKVADEHGFQYCQELWHHFNLIANLPVRNNGTLAGNISIKKAHREFRSDVFLLLETLNAKIIAFRAPNGNPIAFSMAEFMTDTTPQTIILAFELPAYSRDHFIFKSYKIMPRAQNAIAYVNAGFLLELESLATGIVKTSRICFGGIRPDFVHATAVEESLQGQCFYDKGVVQNLFSTLSSSLQPDAVLPNASPEYRMKLASGLLFKFLLVHSPQDRVRQDYISGGPLLRRELSSGLQTFDTKPSNYPVTQPVQKLEALIQCAGEAKYMNDLITSQNTVHCAFVGATKVGRMIESIDASQALQMPGVVAFFSAKDIPGVNSIVDTVQQYELEELFTAGLVRYHSQPLGMIVAQSRDIAERASKKVKVFYSRGGSAVSLMPTLGDVLDNNRLDRIAPMLKPNVSQVKLSAPADYEVNGIFEIGLQYHFTMEPQTCIVIPVEQRTVGQMAKKLEISLQLFIC